LHTQMTSDMCQQHIDEDLLWLAEACNQGCVTISFGCQLRIPQVPYWSHLSASHIQMIAGCKQDCSVLAAIPELLYQPAHEGAGA
jgi:hypothetical protein